MIYIEPQAGLCNRMRAIESAYQLAKEMGTKLCIVWLCNVDCKAMFSELFEKIPGVELIEIPSILGIRTTARYQRFKIKQIMKRCVEVKKCGLCKNAEAVRELAKDKDVYIQSYGVWYPYEGCLNIFKPVKEIDVDIQKKKQEFGEYCVAVHIRRTDNVASITNSSTEMFIERMQAEIEKNQEVSFFVASDSKEEKRRMQEQFGSRIKLNEDIELKRNSKIGMQNAVKDLFLLAACNKILGSAESSYTEMAAEIGNIMCCVVKKEGKL